MSRVFVTGDVHGEMSIARLSGRNWRKGKTLTKDDYVIILGDFGLLWNPTPSPSERYWLKWLENAPWTTLFIDGNHENHERLDALPLCDLFGAKAGYIGPSVYHLRRGEVYTINSKTYFTFGGAQSIDRASRIENISWWRREQPSFTEMDDALILLSAIPDVDYILTHTCPNAIAAIMDPSVRWRTDTDPLGDYFNIIADIASCYKWYFGHWHIDRSFGDQYQAVYNGIIELR